MSCVCKNVDLVCLFCFMFSTLCANQCDSLVWVCELTRYTAICRYWARNAGRFESSMNFSIWIFLSKMFPSTKCFHPSVWRCLCHTIGATQLLLRVIGHCCWVCVCVCVCLCACCLCSFISFLSILFFSNFVPHAKLNSYVMYGLNIEHKMASNKKKSIKSHFFGHKFTIFHSERSKWPARTPHTIQCERGDFKTCQKFFPPSVRFFFIG